MEISRRKFLQSTATASAGLAISQAALAQAEPSASGSSDDLNIAWIGCGAQAQALFTACKDIPGLRYRAVCDIWDKNRNIVKDSLLKYDGLKVNGYVNYQEMLDSEKDLDAVIVATPDWMHAEHAIACMRAGHHVYCEKEMSNSLEKARQMVRVSQETGKLLQIGHQRRSNPRYQWAINKIVHGGRLLGRVNQANAQWNRAKSDPFIAPRGQDVPPKVLEEYGYDSMHHFMNWRWFKKYGGGPIADLGSHQIDIFAWVFKNNPKSVIASGGADFYKSYEWHDNVMAIYEFETPEGIARAFYQVLTTTSNGGFYELFMGEDGTLSISENVKKTEVRRENHIPEAEWDKWIKNGTIKNLADIVAAASSEDTVADVRESPDMVGYGLPVQLGKPYHQPHLENFFGAIRDGRDLNCPGEVGYETAVAVLSVNEAIRLGRPVHFSKHDFEV